MGKKIFYPGIMIICSWQTIPIVPVQMYSAIRFTSMARLCIFLYYKYSIVEIMYRRHWPSKIAATINI